MAARSPSKTRAVPSKTYSSKPADFTTAPSGRERAREDRQAAGLVDRLAPSRAMTWPSMSGGAMSARFSAIVLPVTVRQSPCEQAGVEQRLHDDGDAADPVDVGHDVLPEGLDVGQVRHLGADAEEVVESEVDVGLVGDGEQVQHGVGRAAEGHDDGDGVLEGLLGHDVARGDAAAQQVDDGLARLAGEPVAAPVGGRRRGRARAATCRWPRRPRPSCWRCTCRRRRPRPGRSRARWRRRPRAT